MDRLKFLLRFIKDNDLRRYFYPKKINKLVNELTNCKSNKDAKSLGYQDAIYSSVYNTSLVKSLSIRRARYYDMKWLLTLIICHNTIKLENDYTLIRGIFRFLNEYITTLNKYYALDKTKLIESDFLDIESFDEVEEIKKLYLKSIDIINENDYLFMEEKLHPIAEFAQCNEN